MRRRSPARVPGKTYDILLNSRTADKVTVYFKDGLVISGALIFNSFKGTGRLIDIERELSIDFAIENIRDLRLSRSWSERALQRFAALASSPVLA